VSVHIFGVRHHGPGSARSLERALGELNPDCVLLEGPPDANEVISLASSLEMQPPVALLVYAKDDPACSVFYPFAAFSPEWVALRFALERKAAVRFMDLPQAFQLLPEKPQPVLEPPVGATRRSPLVSSRR